MASQSNMPSIIHPSASSRDPASALPFLIEVHREITLLLQPASFSVLPGMAGPIAPATFLVPAREDERFGAAVVRGYFHLSTREAALNLHLTERTARSYSKRIFAEAGSRDQADLVRNILSGLSPLA